MLSRSACRALRQVSTSRGCLFATTSAPAADLDWDQLSTVVTSDEGRRELASLRTTYIDLQERSQQNAATTKINWDAYKDSVDPQILAMFRKAHSELSFPDYDVQKDIQAAKAKFEPLLKQAEELAVASKKRAGEIQQELKHLEEEKEKITTLTVHEELANDPETAKQIDKEISEGNFLP